MWTYKFHQGGTHINMYRDSYIILDDKPITKPPPPDWQKYNFGFKKKLGQQKDQGLFNPRLVKRYHVNLVKQPENHFKAALNIPKRYPANFTDYTLQSRDDYVKQYGNYNNQPNKTHQNVGKTSYTETLVNIKTNQFPRSEFLTSIPYNFETDQSSHLLFTLKKDGNSVVLNPLEGYLHCDEWITSKEGVMPSKEGILAYQKKILASRSRRVPSKLDLKGVDFQDPDFFKGFK